MIQNLHNNTPELDALTMINLQESNLIFPYTFQTPKKLVTRNRHTSPIHGGIQTDARSNQYPALSVAPVRRKAPTDSGCCFPTRSRPQLARQFVRLTPKSQTPRHTEPSGEFSTKRKNPTKHTRQPHTASAGGGADV